MISSSLYWEVFTKSNTVRDFIQICIPYLGLGGSIERTQDVQKKTPDFLTFLGGIKIDIFQMSYVRLI